MALAGLGLAALAALAGLTALGLACNNKNVG